MITAPGWRLHLSWRAARVLELGECEKADGSLDLPKILALLSNYRFREYYRQCGKKTFRELQQYFEVDYINYGLSQHAIYILAKNGLINERGEIDKEKLCDAIASNDGFPVDGPRPMVLKELSDWMDEHKFLKLCVKSGVITK